MLEQAAIDEPWLFDDPEQSEARSRVELERCVP